MTLESEEKQMIEDILLKGGYVSEEDLKKAEEFAKNRDASMTEYLLSEEIISKDILGQAIAEFFKVPYIDLNSNKPSKDQVLKVDEESAKKFRAVLFSENDQEVVFTTDNPNQPELEIALKNLFKTKKVTIGYSLHEDIDDVLVYYTKSLNTRFSKIIEEKKSIAPEILEELFKDAFTFNASDIHFEPQGEELIVRFRVDGVLQEAGRLPIQYYENILNRVKVQSRLRIDEHFAAQDGSMSFETSLGTVNLRTSIIPTIEGEKIVLRILSSYIKGLTLNDLGLNEADRKILEEASDKPFGMILVVGPTGSGKTTTLYSLIKILNNPETNITTIEDPVEYRVRGINQIQVNQQTDLTFSKGLRSIVRQDPDIILVGEIGDEETAEISINAALTGHLVLSTFHANNASSAVPRLLEMGMEPFLLASTLEVIIAQRLVRRICDTCRFSKNVPKTELVKKYKKAGKYFKGTNITLYEGKGCDVCSGTGYKGRIALFEFIKVTEAVQQLLLQNPSANQIWKVAQKEGAQSLFEDGMKKVESGITTIDELVRVAPPTDDE